MERIILIREGLDGISQQELDDRLLLLPKWRRDYALSFKRPVDRINCCEAYLLLKNGIRQYFGYDIDPKFEYGKNGKPFIKGFPHIHFNISHCDAAVVCALHDAPIGVDVEIVPDDLDMDLCCSCLNEDEIRDVFSSGNPSRKFTLWWTMKESYLKLTGEGLVDDLSSIFEDGRFSKYRFESSEIPGTGSLYTVAQEY